MHEYNQMALIKYKQLDNATFHNQQVEEMFGIKNNKRLEKKNKFSLFEE